jgi:NAD(P)-dependent dehydrogenase (short-subunit alcohol dehydrogenase family)
LINQLSSAIQSGIRIEERDLMRFAKKTVVVTGASSGLGVGMARGFAAEGARVAVIGTNLDRTCASANAILSAGGEARPYLLDVSREPDVNETFARIVQELGDIDVLVNNAGIASGSILSLLTIDPSELDRVMRINVYGAIWCARAARESMARRGGGAILNISSLSSWLPSGGYSLTKAALNNVTLSLAAELSADHIRVNGLAPGRVESPNTERVVSDDVRQAFLQAQLVRRAGQEDDVTSTALFLCSSEASFITAQTLLVDGGFLAHSPKIANGSAAKASVSQS